jgi:Mannosyltransferase (PIG-V)
VGGRLFILAAGFAATYVFGIRNASWAWRFPERAEVFHGWLGNLLNTWAHWDGAWYIKIAAAGYADADGSTAFFPLYPLLIRWIGVVLNGNLEVAGIVISLVCYAASVWLLYRLVAADFGHKVAVRSVVYLSLFPTAFFFQAVYTESLFLLLSLACFWWAREGRWRLSGLAGLLAALTRSTGILLLVPMAVYYYQRRGWRLRRTDADVANLLMVAEGLLVWMTYLSVTFGKPLLFAHVQEQWRRAFLWPNFTIARALEGGIEGLRQLLSRQYIDLYWQVLNPHDAYSVATANLIGLASLVVALLCLFYAARRLPPAYSLYGAAAALFPLFFPARFVPLLSYPRFILVAFPLFIAMAAFTRDKPRAHAAITVTMLLGSVALTAMFAIFAWVA